MYISNCATNMVCSLAPAALYHSLVVYIILNLEGSKSDLNNDQTSLGIRGFEYDGKLGKGQRLRYIEFYCLLAVDWKLLLMPVHSQILDALSSSTQKQNNLGGKLARFKWFT